MKTQNKTGIKKCAIIGAGFMGGSIARFLSKNKIPVILNDINKKLLRRGLKFTNIEGQNPYKRLSKMTLLKIMIQMMKPVNPLIKGTLDYKDMGNVDLIIEALPEDLELKKAVLKEISAVVGEDTIIASNTSSIPLSELAKAVSHPERLIGMHFFYPTDKRPFMEVVEYDKTSEKCVESVMNFVKKCGKQPVLLHDGPGFMVNRVLSLYIREVLYYCVKDGYRIDKIDDALVEFGMPIGPGALLDLVGYDLAYKIASNVIERLSDNKDRVLDFMRKLLTARRQGIDISIYKYKGRQKHPNNNIYEIAGITPSKEIKKTDMIDRIIYLIINETCKCMEEGIVMNEKDADKAIKSGMGFPFGGPMAYARSIGIKNIVCRLDEYKNRYGDRYKCCDYLRDMAYKKEASLG